MTRAPRKANDLTPLDAFLAEQGVREAFQAIAIKEVLAWQIEQAMKDQGLSRKGLAERMGTSRSQISRLLDPTDGNVTLTTLQRAAEMVGPQGAVGVGLTGWQAIATGMKCVAVDPACIRSRRFRSCKPIKQLPPHINLNRPPQR